METTRIERPSEVFVLRSPLYIETRIVPRQQTKIEAGRIAEQTRIRGEDFEMPEAEAHNGDGTTQEKTKSYSTLEFLIDLGTLAVLTITMVYVIKYANEAAKQSGFLDTSVQQQIKNVDEQVVISRPVVLADGMQVARPAPKVAGEYLLGGSKPTENAIVTVINFGKTVAFDVTVIGGLRIGRPEEPAPADPQCDPGVDPPHDSKKTPLAPVNESIPPSLTNLMRILWQFKNGDTLKDFTAGANLYSVGCIYYEALDKKRYYTDICTIWHNGTFETCANPDRNFVRERPDSK
jgi:hypothetical protein